MTTFHCILQFLWRKTYVVKETLYMYLSLYIFLLKRAEHLHDLYVW